MWNHRLFLLTARRATSTCMEQTLYNGVLAGRVPRRKRVLLHQPAGVGRRRSRSTRAARDGSGGSTSPAVPTSLCRFFPSLPGYVYAVAGRSIYANLFIAGSASRGDRRGDARRIVQETDYPWAGTVRFTLHPEHPGTAAVPGPHPRMGAGADPRRRASTGSTDQPVEPFRLSVNGSAWNRRPVEDGYAVIDRAWRDGDIVELVLPLPGPQGPLRSPGGRQPREGRPAARPARLLRGRPRCRVPLDDLLLGEETRPGSAPPAGTPRRNRGDPRGRLHGDSLLRLGKPRAPAPCGSGCETTRPAREPRGRRRMRRRSSPTPPREWLRLRGGGHRTAGGAARGDRPHGRGSGALDEASPGNGWASSSSSAPAWLSVRAVDHRRGGAAAASRVCFHWRGERVPVTVPPAYIQFDEAGRKVQDLLSADPRAGGIPRRARPPARRSSSPRGWGSPRTDGTTSPTSPEWAASCGWPRSTPTFRPKEVHWHAPRMLPRCEHCRSCARACPTGAIAADRFLLHAERCLVFHNERPGTIPFPRWIPAGEPRMPRGLHEVPGGVPGEPRPAWTT